MSDVTLNTASGAITLTAANSSGNKTLTLPAVSDTLVGKATTDTLTNKSIVATQLTGTIAAARLPTGSVLQVVSANTTTQTTTSGTSYVDTGITATITPTSSSSVILIIVSVNGCEKTNASTQNSLHLQLLRNAASISEFAHYLLYTNSLVANCGACTTNYLDNPATTASTTYKVQFRNEAASGAVYVQSSSAKSTITLMEIAG